MWDTVYCLDRVLGWRLVGVVMPRFLIKPETCPTCGGQSRPSRYGARLTPFLALIFDKVLRAGTSGIEKRDLETYLENTTGKLGGEKSVSMSMTRINKEFKHAGVEHRIRCYRCYSATQEDGKRLCTSYYYLDGP